MGEDQEDDQEGGGMHNFTYACMDFEEIFHVYMYHTDSIIVICCNQWLPPAQETKALSNNNDVNGYKFSNA